METTNISRVAACIRCDWRNEVKGADLRAVAEATVRFEDHLQAVHAMSCDEAHVEAERWAIQILGEQAG